MIIFFSSADDDKEGALRVGLSSAHLGRFDGELP